MHGIRVGLQRKPVIFAGVLLVMGLFFAWTHMASAQYVENNLIDDGIFLNAASMSQAQIQSFLAARGGYLASYNAYSDRDGATVPASRIIYEAAQDYGLNPQAILATLQKEQSLVTATNPAASQLNYAMGYGCPDSTGCGTTYLGFYNQVANGTWQLRFNFERARGNNSWWNSNLSYPCGGKTRYYSTGLYVGRNVTFYDDYGTGYKAFTINDAATASLYCYTPHVYPGSGAEYYSGSYNFVVTFEQWFGSTQPAVEMASALRVSTVPQGVFVNAPTTASFDLANTTDSTVTMSVAVTVRDSSGGNHDLSLKAITIPAHGTATYSATTTFTTEGTYTFGVTSLTNGIWDDATPVSANIDNPRTLTLNMLAIPTVTVAPASNVTDMRVGKVANMTFTVRNNSQQAMSVGRLALALRGPNGENRDLALVSPGTLPAGGTYTYTQPFTPSTTGTFSGFITDTPDNGLTWNETNYPAQASGIARTIQFTVKSSPTLTQGPTLSVQSPRVGQQVTASFKIKNFGDSAVSVGYVAYAIRDPQGHNVDAGGVNLTVNPATEYTFQVTPTFQTPGTYTAWVSVYRNGVWDDTTSPPAEDATVVRRITFTVLPSPTVTVQPTITTANPCVGKAATATFTVHNYGSQDVNAGQMALAVRDPNGRNADFSLQNVVIPAGSDYVYTATSSSTAFQTPGTYTAWITTYRNGTWDDTTYPTAESASVARRITFTVLPNPAIVTSVQATGATRVGQAFTLSFDVENFGTTAVDLGYIGLGGRDALGRNVDPGITAVTLAPGEQKTISFSVTPSSAGAINYFVISTANFNTWSTGPAAASGVVSKTLAVNITN